MSLFGAMSSGVSGLAAQSSAMAAIADNITNVNTAGYKSTEIDFQTLVTKQGASTAYSSGGVQSRPHSGVSVQGLLQSSSSRTDLAISGDGFFLVNEASTPGSSDQFYFSRAGSFQMDGQGFLKNAAGYYLQAWPTDADGNVILPSSSNAALTNQNIISSDFLETVNLNRVGGTATETSNISIGANLPAGDAVGDSHNVDVQFFDTLGATNAVAFDFTKTATNQWDLDVEPPRGTATLSLYDDQGNVYRSMGQLEFLTQPSDGDTLTITHATSPTPTTVTYEFESGGGVTAGNVAVPIGGSLSQTIASLVTAFGGDATFGGATGNAVAAKAGYPTTMVLTGGSGGADFTVDTSGLSAGVTRQQMLASSTFSVQQSTTPASAAIVFNSTGEPALFGVASMEVTGFVNGAASMDGVSTSRIAIDFGSPNEADGMTQGEGEFTPNFIEQNGAKFGVFNGISISSDGLMLALFDNGEQRPIYRIPVVTLVNPDGMSPHTGNVWSATDASGNPTLQTANSGPAGQIVQSSLEASTVDIGEEFTNMIVVQRAYSAATRIISTADDMLEELVRIKR